MKIVPSVLAEDRDDFVLRMRQAEDFAEYVQMAGNPKEDYERFIERPHELRRPR